MVAPAAGQPPVRSDTVVTLDELVVTADRSARPLASSIAAVSTVSAEQIARIPHATLADALRTVPGFALIDFDGLGYDPQLVVRGFYGGGEAEYVLVMVDGRPVNDVQTGRVAWDGIPVSAIERVEIVRGGASALWGDAAIGGVINVITRAPGDEAARWTLSAGSHGTWRGGADANLRIAERDVTLFGGADRTAGFRDNAWRTAGRAGGSLMVASGPAGSVRLSTLTHWREFDEPGPLPAARLDDERTASEVFHRFDRTEDRSHRLGVDASRSLGSRARLAGELSAELRHTAAVRTIVLAPGFADTKERVLDSRRAVGGARLTIDGTGLPLDDGVTLGFDASYGTLGSDYYAVLTGDGEAYGAADGARGELDASGNAERAAAAAYVQYTLYPVSAVRLSLGARADWLRDAFDPRVPEDSEPLDATHTAFSPRIGLNIEYVRSGGNTGHVYATAGRSFKAPTLDQLFDQRRLPVPFPPFAVATSNALLDPQHGTNLEGGLYHTSELVPGGLTAALSFAAYQMDMEDELDFDLETLRYVNIGRSRHRGVEAGLELRSPRAGAAFLTYSRQVATARAGANLGRRLKAIPGHFLTAGASAAIVDPLEIGTVVSRAWDTFIDDANTLELPAYTRVDVHAALTLLGRQVFLNIRNLFDAEYSTTAFPDPSGTGEVYHHPAAGRTLEVGVRGGF